jgi:hypothetical protein
MSNGIGVSLKTGKGGETWLSLVPYSLDILAAHIERQFLVGMSWHNFGLWHIDHITPLRMFRFNSASDEEFIAAWGLPNLRPLWAIDNLRKNGRRTHLI